MPSQLANGYRAENAAAAPGTMAPSYSWSSQQQGSQPPPTTAPPTAYYAYAIAPTTSYDSHQHPTAQRSASDVTAQGVVSDTQSQQGGSFDETRQGSYNYSNNTNGGNIQTVSSQERVGPSSSPQTVSTRPPPEGNAAAYAVPIQAPPPGNVPTDSTNNTSPSKMPPGPPPPGYTAGQPMPYFFVAQPAQPGYPQYAWAYAGPSPYPPPSHPPPPPHAQQQPPPPPPPPPHYASPPPQTQAAAKKAKSDSEHKGKMERVRTMSPSQLESCRRDEVANMGCTCKKSKCLKLYCMCFGASVVCGANCRCLVCYNTNEHDAERKEAIRIILSRNPAAFDTKFKKTPASEGGKKGSKAASGEGDAAPERVLSHKIGCKCRKSQCTKKYCECYNAGIKCSGICRCTGCQNMPAGGFGPDPRYGYPVPVPTAPYAAAAMMPSGTSIAAQNLAYLKNSSPNKPPGAVLNDGPRGGAPMRPVVSSDDTPTSKAGASPQVGPPVQKARAKSEEGGVASVLLMAAMAMTEMADESPAKRRSTMKTTTTTSESPPAAHSTTSSSSMPRASPKRKSPPEFGDALGSNEYDDEKPPNPFSFSKKSQKVGSTSTKSTSGAPVGSSAPAKQRKPSKRSRVGTTRKLPLASKSKASTTSTTSSPASKRRGRKAKESKSKKSPSSTTQAMDEDEEEPTTPMLTRSKRSEALTPVSARCIDFRRMDMRRGESDGGSDGSHAEQREEVTAA